MAGDEPQGDAFRPLTDIDRLIHEPARLMILSFLEAVDSADYVFLMRVSGLTWGNLSSHMTKLEEAGYVTVKKEFLNKKPHSMAQLTLQGKQALEAYRLVMKKALEGYSL
ncbi:MAG: transcriptional regulator [Anaerolineales bacterium]|nr:transcriptional regulator [Anaerolineales bacterium]